MHFHDVLHSFWDHQVIGTATMELKTTHEMASIEHDLLLPVLLKLRKTYDTLDFRCLLHNLEGYGADSKLCGILMEFWDKQEVVTSKSGYHAL